MAGWEDAAPAEHSRASSPVCFSIAALPGPHHILALARSLPPWKNTSGLPRANEDH